jgi:hypothetical protein
MTATTYLALGRDVQGINANAPQFSTVMYSATLAAGAAESVTVPLDALAYIMYVKVQPNGWVWVSRTTTAAVPAGGTFAAIASEMVDGATDEYKRLVYPKDVISFITANTTCDVSVVFYAVGYP